MSKSPIIDALDNLKTKLTGMTDAAQAEIAAFKALADQMRANANAPAMINELAAQVDAQAKSFSDAIQANTV